MDINTRSHHAPAGSAIQGTTISSRRDLTRSEYTVAATPDELSLVEPSEFLAALIGAEPVWRAWPLLTGGEQVGASIQPAFDRFNGRLIDALPPNV